MTQPPAGIVRTLEPVGELQLYRLDKRVRFRCAQCQRDKTHDLVATMGGSWAQTVCVGCYITLARMQRENTKMTAKEKRENTKKTAEERKLKRRLPGIDRLLAFFRAAGVDAELLRDGCLRINGSQTKPLAWILPSPHALDWNNIIDEMTLKYVGDKFVKAAENNARFGVGLRAFLRQHERGFVIMCDDVRLAIIHPTRAQIVHREDIFANFLVPGPHWQQVADVLHGAEPELVAEWKREQEARAAAEAAAAATEAERRRAAPQRRMDHLPDGLAPELIDACVDASRRIRLERQVAYERPVVLESHLGELTLLPITTAQTRLLLPFRLNRGMEALKGELLLGDRDPLPLLIGGDIADEDAIAAWTCALLGFADATCVEFVPAEPTTRRERARPRQPPSSASHRHSSTQTLPRRGPWPRHLEPVGHWIRYSGSFVPGHRRRLNDGQTASAEARDRAQQVGIILRSQETWVRPHTRGVPDGIEMRFLWHTPIQLKLSQTQPTSRGEH